MTDLTEVLARAIRLTFLNRDKFGCYEDSEIADATAVIIAALNADGYQIVPKEPDDSMTLAAQRAYDASKYPGHFAAEMRKLLRAAIAAAPKP